MGPLGSPYLCLFPLFPRHPPGDHSLIGAKTPVLPCPLLFVTPFTTVSTHQPSKKYGQSQKAVGSGSVEQATFSINPQPMIYFLMHENFSGLMDQHLKPEWIPPCSHSNTLIQCLLLSHVLPHYNPKTNKDVFGCGCALTHENSEIKLR